MFARLFAPLTMRDVVWLEAWRDDGQLHYVRYADGQWAVFSYDVHMHGWLPKNAKRRPVLQWLERQERV